MWTDFFFTTFTYEKCEKTGNKAQKLPLLTKSNKKRAKLHQIFLFYIQWCSTKFVLEFVEFPGQQTLWNHFVSTKFTEQGVADENKRVSLAILVLFFNSKKAPANIYILYF